MLLLTYRIGVRNRPWAIRRLRTVHSGWIVLQRADNVRRIIPIYRGCVFPICRQRGTQ
jgi:hypothetical protein